MAKNSLDKTREIKVLLAQIKAFIDTIQDILNNKDAAEHNRYVAYKDMAYMYNDFAEQVQKVLDISSIIYTFQVDKMPGFMDTVWGMQKKILEQILLSSKLLCATLEGSVDFVDDEFDNIENFISSRLRTVIFSKPEKEIEIQNAVESLLLGRGLNKGTDYDRESGKFEFSGKEYIPDFIIQKLKLCIEVKLLRLGRKSRVIDEISADITAYSKQYDRQLYIVYDLGVIQNEVEFRRDIEKSGDVKVIIVKH
ncbi:PD-(D/E)XK nuclease domain-containing protein [Paraclostridium bifermentans]|uniref:PD-(D/E)XK nuclease domain-containing protein n=1 Tax=Paraclostridium bifermentans TaxID=1490 RepID=UPI00359C9142